MQYILTKDKFESALEKNDIVAIYSGSTPIAPNLRSEILKLGQKIAYFEAAPDLQKHFEKEMEMQDTSFICGFVDADAADVLELNKDTTPEAVFIYLKDLIKIYEDSS